MYILFLLPVKLEGLLVSKITILQGRNHIATKGSTEKSKNHTSSVDLCSHCLYQITKVHNPWEPPLRSR